MSRKEAAMNNNEERYRGWYAICDHLERKIRVGGEVQCPSRGWSAELRTKDNTANNQFMLHLDLVVTPPDQNVEQAITWVPVEWRESPAIEYQEVKIHRADASAPPTLDVQHLIRRETAATG
jgi:nitrite reductase/ring-hydroxylating ferredoxin subunit